jgi:hypothetical protein
MYVLELGSLGDLYRGEENSVPLVRGHVDDPASSCR